MNTSRDAVKSRVRREVDALFETFGHPDEACGSSQPSKRARQVRDIQSNSQTSCPRSESPNSGTLSATPECSDAARGDTAGCSDSAESISDSSGSSAEDFCDWSSPEHRDDLSGFLPNEDCASAQEATGRAPDESSSGDFKALLAQWALEHNIAHRSLTPLLGILRTHGCFQSLPKDARTLLKTPRNTADVAGVSELPPGLYCHYGLRRGLERVLACLDGCPQLVSLNFNIDGIPLSKSSRQQLWPIQCLVLSCGSVLSERPFIVGAFFGPSKPSCANMFLRPFVDDLKDVLVEGVLVKGSLVRVEVSSVICDAPARSFIFKTKGHSSYNGCPKCTAEGSYADRVCFSPTAGVPRTDQSFRQQQDPDHHQGVSILTELPIDCIRNVPLDPMHLVYLGVARKLVNLWLSGPLSVRLGPLEREEISKQSLALQNNVPCEFARKPRGLDEKDRWKATEFRLFLHYTGPIILKESLSEAAYKNFLTLHVATSILSTPGLCQEHGAYANTLLDHFVKGFVDLYGASNVSYNVHCLLHLATDCELYGTLDAFSAFPFESNLQLVKKLLRRPGFPLSQLYNRMHERAHAEPVGARHTADYELLGGYEGDGLPLGCKSPQYASVKFPSFTLSKKEADRCCKINDDVVLIHMIAHDQNGQPCIIGRCFLSAEPLYSYPFDSRRLGIAVVDKLSSLRCWPIVNIRKLVLLPYNGMYVVLPLLHTSACH